MKQFRTQYWSQSLLLLLTAVALLTVGCTKKGPESSEGSVFKFAKKVPASAQFAAGWDVADDINFESWIKDIRGVHPDADKALGELKADIGFTAEELLLVFDKSGFTFSLEGQTPDNPAVVGVLGLADSKKFAELWQQNNELSQAVEIEGVSFYVQSDGRYEGFDDRWFYTSSGEPELKTLLKTMKGQEPSLATSESFKEAVSRLEVDDPSAFFFVDTEETIKMAAQKTSPDTDSKTWEELKSVKYVIGTADLKEKQFDVFVKVEGESKLAKTLRTPGTLKSTTLKEFSAETQAYLSLDFPWFWEMGLALGETSPNSRSYVAMASAGAEQYKPFDAFSGELSYGLKMGSVFNSLVKGAFDLDRGEYSYEFGAVIAPVKDPKLTNKLVSSLIGGESTLVEGEDTAYSSPAWMKFFLRAKSPQALILQSSQNDGILDSSKGNLAENSVVKKSLNWGGDQVVYLDYINIEPALNVISEACEEANTEEAKATKSVVEMIRSHSSSLEASSCLRVEEDGLRYRSYGTANLVTTGMAASSAIGYLSLRSSPDSQTADFESTGASKDDLEKPISSAEAEGEPTQGTPGVVVDDE